MLSIIIFGIGCLKIYLYLSLSNDLIKFYYIFDFVLSDRLTSNGRVKLGIDSKGLFVFYSGKGFAYFISKGLVLSGITLSRLSLF